MDPNLAILALSAVVILAYLFEIVGRRLKLPSVVLLLAAGIAMRAVFDSTGWTVPYLRDLLPLLGTIGLVLIVLEGALDLELSREKRALVARTLAAAVAGLAASMVAIAAGLHYGLDADWRLAFLTAAPFAVISSAIAIPSASALEPRRSEFVVYESAFSDIVGVSVFAALVEGDGDAASFAGHLAVSSTASILLGVVFIGLLYVLLNRLGGHVKFLPILFLLMALYAIGKFVHLSPLILVLAFGLLLNNPSALRRLPWLRRHESTTFPQDVVQFKQIVAEGAFFVRTYFFLLLGYSTALAQFASTRTWAIAAAILAAVYATRLPLLAAVAPRDVRPLLWIAPRGLITVMLFLSLPADAHIPGFPDGVLMLVVLLSAVVMMVGIGRAPAACDSVPAPGDSAPAAGDSVVASRPP